MRLEIAAGDRPTPGFTHHDARELHDIEIVCDMWDLSEYVPIATCDEVRATHILEHFSHLETKAVLNFWRNLLKPGGLLYIEVPNGEWQVKAAASGEIDFNEFVRLAYGDQDYPGNAHFASFSPATLKSYLELAGFSNVRVDDIGMVLCAWANRGE